jgi:O-antigen/teichoic acid export membrane protein
MNLKEKAVSGFKWTSFATIAVVSVQVIQLLVVSRYLAPKDFGLVAIVTTIIFFMRSFSDMGVSAAVIHKKEITDDQFSSLFWLNIFVGILLFIISIIFSFFIGKVFKEDILKEIFLVIASTFLIIPFGALFQIILQKNFKFEVLAVQEISASIIGGFLTVIMAVYGYGYWSLIFGYMINTIVRTIVVFIRGRKYVQIKFLFDYIQIKSFINFGLFQMGERSVNFLNERLDQLLIGYFLGPVQLGYYSFAYNLVSQPITVLNPIFTKVAFPLFAKLQDNKDLLKKTYLKLIKIITIINAPLLLGLLLEAPLLIPIFFGSKWNNSILIIQILCIVSLFKVINNPTGSLILAVGKANIGFYWNLAVMLLTIPFILIGAKLGSIYYISVSLIILQVIIQYPSYRVLIQKYINSKLFEYFESCAKPISYTFFMIISIIAISFLKVSGLNLLILQTITGGVIYFITLYILEKDDIYEIKSLLIKKSLKL